MAMMFPKCATTMALASPNIVSLGQPFSSPSVARFGPSSHRLKPNFVDFSSRTRISAAPSEFADSSGFSDSVRTSDEHQVKFLFAIFKWFTVFGVFRDVRGY